MRLKWLKWIFPLLLLGLLAPFSKHIDLALSNVFFSPLKQSFSQAFYHSWIYYYAVYPALIVGVGSGILFLASFKFSKLLKNRYVFFFLAFSMLLGAGIITHIVFKKFCFRPRPRQTLLFGGSYPFQPFFLLKFKYPNFCKSFPSGHATMGFYFINLIILGYELNKKWLKNVGIISTLLMSSILCFSRIAQGAHFFSDVTMSLVVTWYAALVAQKLSFEFLAKKSHGGINGGLVTISSERE